jgi:sialate O-acetylesterase
LFNGMIAPLTKFVLRGVIWYQGESNVGRAAEYRRLFPTMITDWRKVWGLGDFPFLFVQLANFLAPKPEPSESAWAELREAQTFALKLPNTGMATAVDIGDANDIHPRNKQEVGRRLALVARALVFRSRLRADAGGR